MDPEKDTMFRVIVVVMLAVVAVALVFDGATRRVTNAVAEGRTSTQAAATSTTPASTYHPVTRTFIVTTVPQLVHEQTGQFDYLGQDFAKGGTLEGKEVWGFSPDTLTVYEGDTVNVTVVNPSGDDHTFTLPDVGFNLLVKAQSTASGTFVASKVGPYSYICTIAEHSPYMWGELVILPDSAAPQS
jgi:plastocyanin